MDDEGKSLEELLAEATISEGAVCFRRVLSEPERERVERYLMDLYEING